MQVDHHDLINEFPEYKDAIEALRAKNGHFAKMFDDYQSITHQVENLEEDDMPVDDLVMEDLKKQRVVLKDELYRMLVASKA